MYHGDLRQWDVVDQDFDQDVEMAKERYTSAREDLEALRKEEEVDWDHFRGFDPSNNHQP